MVIVSTKAFLHISKILSSTGNAGCPVTCSHFFSGTGRRPPLRSRDPFFIARMMRSGTKSRDAFGRSFWKLNDNGYLDALLPCGCGNRFQLNSYLDAMLISQRSERICCCQRTTNSCRRSVHLDIAKLLAGSFLVLDSWQINCPSARKLSALPQTLHTNQRVSQRQIGSESQIGLLIQVRAC
jgi:hypothetical protein